MHQPRRTARLVLVPAIALGLAGALQAQTFHFDSYGGFIVNSGLASPGANVVYVNDPDTATGGGTWDVGADVDARTAAGRFKDVNWGVPQGSTGPYGGKSGLALSKVNNGIAVVAGALVDFGTLTHFNRPINTDTHLDAIDMDWSLALFATASDAAGDTNPVQTLNMSFRIFNWETPNSPAANPAYTVSYDNGATWTTVGPGVCPGSTPVGTLIVGHMNRIYRSANADRASNPVWNGQCADAHVYEPIGSNPTTFTYQGRTYRVELVGFYGRDGSLTGTFWACEGQDCWGTVKFRILDETVVADVPTLSEWALVLTTLLLAASGAVLLRGRAR